MAGSATSTPTIRGRRFAPATPFTLYSPALLTTQNEYLLARRGHAHAETSEVATVRDYSDRLLDAARQRLRLWDLTESDIQELDQKGQATGLVTFRAPSGGVVVEKIAVEGMRVMAGQRVRLAARRTGPAGAA